MPIAGHVLTLATGALERLTLDGAQNTRPEWTPDGRVLYISDRGERRGLWVQPVDGSAPPRPVLVLADREVWQGMISADGQYLLYRTGTLSAADVFYRRLSGDTTEVPIVESRATEQSPYLSPDGRWVSYSTTQSGTTEVFVKPFPSLSARYRIGAGRDAMWAPDSRSLYFTNGGLVLRARVNTVGEFAVQRIDTVASGDVAMNAGHPVIHPTRDGQLLYVRPLAQPRPAVVVTNWKRELNRD